MKLPRLTSLTAVTDAQGKPGGLFQRFWNTICDAIESRAPTDSPAFTGTVELGTAYVPGAPAATGYILIKDSAGTTYKILVST